MTKRMLIGCAMALMSTVGFYAAGCNDTVTAKDCRVSCQDVDNTCVKACTDDACKSKCVTDLDNCTASCGSVSASPPADGGAQ